MSAVAGLGGVAWLEGLEAFGFTMNLNPARSYAETMTAIAVGSSYPNINRKHSISSIFLNQTSIIVRRHDGSFEFGLCIMGSRPCTMRERKSLKILPQSIVE